MLTLLHIKKYYDKHLVLDIPLLELDTKIYWAKGVNGSGKTTLLRMAAGLLPFDGDILLGQISLKRHSLSYRRSVSWADAEPLYPPFMTGTEIIKFYKNIRRSSAAETDLLTELFGMQDYISQKISTYSSGMTKKLSLVLAFMGNLRLIVLDEPLITLDAEAMREVCRLILSRHRINGTTFLLSSHMHLEKGVLENAQELLVSNRKVAFA